MFVKDQDKALDFYTTKLGFEKRADNPGPEGRFLLIGLPKGGLEILLWPGTPGRAAEGLGAPAAAAGQLFLESDDLRKDGAELLRKGVKFEREPEAYPYGMRAEMFDPDGNRISLRQRPK